MFKSSILNLIANGSPLVRYQSADNSMIWSVLRQRLLRLRVAAAVARERKALKRLSESQLHDIGITRIQAQREAARAYFDIPNERLTVVGLLDCGDRNRSNKKY